MIIDVTDQFRHELGLDIRLHGGAVLRQAVSNHDLEMIKYLLNLPDEMISFLTGDRLRIALAQNEFQIRYVDFFSLTETIEVKIGRQKMLRLSAEIDHYPDLHILWNPKKRGKIGCYDVEHQEYADLCSFSEFKTQPERYLLKFFEGEL